MPPRRGLAPAANALTSDQQAAGPIVATAAVAEVLAYLIRLKRIVL